MCRFIFKILTILLVFIHCSDLPRDNVLDPGNPNSYQSSIILLEAFVNTNNPYSYNQWALQALDTIQGMYGSHITILEYHRDTEEFSDPYSKPLIFEPLYEKYIENSIIQVKGVPDIFINGASQRVQGASSISNVVARIHTILSKNVGLNNYFTLEPADIQFSGNQLFMSCKIARLGNQSARNLTLRAVICREIDSQDLKRVAIDLVKSDQISVIEAGEIRTIQFEPVGVSQTPDFIVFSLTSRDELIVHQNMKVNL